MLDYTDVPGDGSSRDVDLPAGGAFWRAAQRHHGENIGDTPTHVILVELKHPTDGAASPEAVPLGPS